MPEDMKIPNGFEIDQALKEFEAKKAEQIPKPLEAPAKPPEAPKVSVTPDNSEISQALKEFEVKSSVEQVRKIPEVSKNSDLPRMVRLVMKLSGGAIKEQRQAEYVLLGFAIVFFSISMFLFFKK